MSEHTPGPWTVTRMAPMPISISAIPRSDWYAIDEVPEAERTIAAVWIEANARLIAAAPKMLEAFHYIAGLSKGWDEDGSLGPREPLRWETVARMAMDTARAAIAVAEGR